MQIDGGQTAIFQGVAGPHLRHAVFQKRFKNQAPETPMAHHAIMFFEIRLFVGRKINGLFPAEPIVRRQRFKKVRRPIPRLFLGSAGGVELRYRSFP